MNIVESLRQYSKHDGVVHDKPVLTRHMVKAADEIERLLSIPSKLRTDHFAAAHTDMVGDEERREGYLAALKEVEALNQQKRGAK